MAAKKKPAKRSRVQRFASEEALYVAVRRWCLAEFTKRWGGARWEQSGMASVVVDPYFSGEVTDDDAARAALSKLGQAYRAAQRFVHRAAAKTHRQGGATDWLRAWLVDAERSAFGAELLKAGELLAKMPSEASATTIAERLAFAMLEAPRPATLTDRAVVRLLAGDRPLLGARAKLASVGEVVAAEETKLRNRST